MLGECFTSEPHLQPRGFPVTIPKSTVDLSFGKPKRVKEKNNWERVGGECKSFKEKFMKCLHDKNYENALCRNESKEYLMCRMQRQLMAPEPLEKLGFRDIMEEKPEAKDKC